MAVIQISKIQHRRGLGADLPQLSSAEIGWVIDERKLYIGNGTTSEGAPQIGNTEILTQYSDILGSINSYTYKGTEVGYTAQTSSSGADVQRSLQKKLDDFINAKDFGVVGDGVTDDTAKINFMLQQVYTREHTNDKSYKAIYFPSGTYLISGTIKFPRNATIIGNGAGATIFKNAGTVAPAGETADSKQQTGSNVALGGALTPKNITIQNCQFYQTENHDTFLVDQANFVTFNNVRFRGRHGNSSVTSIGNRKAGVRLTQSTSNTSKNIVFNSCDFVKQDLCFDCDHDAQNVTFNNCYFQEGFAGIICGENITGSAPSVTGPNGVKVLNSTFENLYNLGIKTVTVTNFVSSFNTFINVGVAGAGSAGTALVPVINYDANGNYSIGDNFDRTTTQQATHPNLQNNGKAVYGLLASDSIHYGTHKTEAGKTETLTDNTTSGDTAIDFDESTLTEHVIDYMITRGTGTRTGCIKVTGNNTLGYFVDDDYSETNDLGVTLQMDNANGVLQYTTSSTGSDATFKYRIQKFV